MRADKAVRQRTRPKIESAGRVIGKQLLKLRERSGESQNDALVDVHTRHNGQTLAWWRLRQPEVGRVHSISRGAGIIRQMPGLNR
jgi:hypothetical protein